MNKAPGKYSELLEWNPLNQNFYKSTKYLSEYPSSNQKKKKNYIAYIFNVTPQLQNVEKLS